MLYEIENECLSALCQMRNKLPELFNPTVSKLDLFLRQKVDLGHQSTVYILIIEISVAHSR